MHIHRLSPYGGGDGYPRIIHASSIIYGHPRITHRSPWPWIMDILGKSMAIQKVTDNSWTPFHYPCTTMRGSSTDVHGLITHWNLKGIDGYSFMHIRLIWRQRLSKSFPPRLKRKTQPNFSASGDPHQSGRPELEIWAVACIGFGAEFSCPGYG